MNDKHDWVLAKYRSNSIQNVWGCTKCEYTVKLFFYKDAPNRPDSDMKVHGMTCSELQIFYYLNE